MDLGGKVPESSDNLGNAGNGGNTGNETSTHADWNPSTFSNQEGATRPKARYHTPITAAARLERSKETVKKWCQDPVKRQRLGAYKQAGRWKIPFDHFEKIVAHAEATGGDIF